MSAENVDIIRRGYEEFIATGEPTEDIMAPEFVWDMSTFRDWPERNTYEGVAVDRVESGTDTTGFVLEALREGVELDVRVDVGLA
jgi:hypothetical protein